MENTKALKTKIGRYEKSGRLESLGVFMPITNTEKADLMCPRLYSMSYVEELQSPLKGEALLYGIAYHEILEHVLKTIMVDDEAIPSLSILQIAVDEMAPAILYRLCQEHETDPQIVDDMSDRISRSFEGWFNNWESQIHPFYRCVGVELVVAMPITGDRGEPFDMPIYIVNDGDGYRPARIAEEGAYLQSVPFYRIGKIDALLECRETGALYILDHKTAGSISSYGRKFVYDTQLVGYAACMRWEIEHGAYQQWKGRKIKGVIWDLINSKPPAVPKPLKSGKLSKAMTKAPPSYIFRRAVEAHGFDMEDYEDHIAELRDKVDGNHHKCLTESIYGGDMDRLEREDYGHATMIHSLRKALIMSDGRSIDSVAPRLPVCSKFGTCKLGTVCTAGENPKDSISPRAVRVRWEEEKEKEEKALF